MRMINQSPTEWPDQTNVKTNKKKNFFFLKKNLFSISNWWISDRCAFELSSRCSSWSRRSALQSFPMRSSDTGQQFRVDWLFRPATSLAIRRPIAASNEKWVPYVDCSITGCLRAIQFIDLRFHLFAWVAGLHQEIIFSLKITYWFIVNLDFQVETKRWDKKIVLFCKHGSNAFALKKKLFIYFNDRVRFLRTFRTPCIDVFQSPVSCVFLDDR